MTTQSRDPMRSRHTYATEPTGNTGTHHWQYATTTSATPWNTTNTPRKWHNTHTHSLTHTHIEFMVSLIMLGP